jgi:hypothetical protein
LEGRYLMALGGDEKHVSIKFSVEMTLQSILHCLKVLEKVIYEALYNDFTSCAAEFATEFRLFEFSIIFVKFYSYSEFSFVSSTFYQNYSHPNVSSTWLEGGVSFDLSGTK